MDLAGLATVCDMVPLRGENRRIARQGMEAVARTRKPGLRALMAVADLEPGDVDAQSAGFRLGPRINAAGRLQRADAALELMLTEDPERADRDRARAGRPQPRPARDRAAHPARGRGAVRCPSCTRARWWWRGRTGTPGVVGIVASRLVERFRRPAVVIALDGDSGRGSGRSIGAV